MKRIFSLLLLILAIVPVKNLSAEPPTARIIDGIAESADSYPYVARIEYDGDILCTGTLVSPRHVLTAAHCFYGEDNTVAIGNNEVTVRFGSSQTRQSSKITIHPTYVSRTEGACYDGELDAAVITLASEVSGVTPVPMMSESITQGATVFLAGFGTQGQGGTGEDGTVPAVGTINTGTASVDGFGDSPPDSNPNSSYFHWQFIAGEQNTGSGDSGGPAFYDVNGQRHLAGITCGGYGNSEYSTYSMDTRIEKIKSWVDSNIGNTPVQTASVNIKAAELHFSNDRTDYLYLRGQLTVGSGFKPRGKSITVKIGNYTRTFKLNADAESGNSKSYLGLTGSYRGASFKGSVVRYDMEFERLPALFQEFPGFGFPVSSEASVSQEQVIPITVTVNGAEASTSSILIFKSKGKGWRVKPGQ